MILQLSFAINMYQWNLQTILLYITDCLTERPMNDNQFNMPTHDFHIKVEKTCTVEKLKKKILIRIMKETGNEDAEVSLDDMVLRKMVRMSRGRIITDEKKTLEEIGIEEYDSILIEWKQTGKTIDLEFYEVIHPQVVYVSNKSYTVTFDRKLTIKQVYVSNKMIF